MRSLSSQPPSKPLPKDQLPPESPKSDKAGASSHHHPAVAPSPATPTLEDLMSQEGVPDNEELVAALNAAPPQEQRQWIQKAVEWFEGRTIATLTPAAIRDYVVLAHVQVTPANKQLLKSYFDSLCNKVKAGSFGEELLIQSLVYALANIDPAIFAGDPQPLLYLGKNLLEKLNPSQREFKQADYPSARASLEALFQAFVLAKEVAPRHLNVQEGSLYQSFRSRLQEIIDRAQYYPASYHARLIKQTLQLLEDPQIGWKDNSRRVFQGLLGATNLMAVGQGLASLELKPAQFQAGIDLLQKAFRGQRIQPEPWYSELLSLEESMLRCLQEEALRAYPEPAALVQRAKDIPAQCRPLERLAAFVGADTINQYQQALCFGIAMQLQILSLEGPNPEVRTGSIKRIIALTRPDAWGSNADVMFGLLDTLALVTSQSHSSRSAEVARAREALEALSPELSDVSSRQSDMRGHLIRPQSSQDAASKAFSAWLAGEELTSKLQRLQEQTPRDEDRLFTHVKKALRQSDTESLKVHEVANIPGINSCILHAKLSHFVERTDITEQLSAILANQDKGVCVLYGFGGAGKSTLAAHYGHARKDAQTVRWISAEDSFQLQEGYEQLAQELQVAYKPLAQQLDANSQQYRQELARVVYNALARNNQSTLLILDNAQDPSLVTDYLLHRPNAIQAIITTRSAEAFEGKYTQLQLDPFSQDESKGYLKGRFKEMNRAYTAQEVASLFEEVGPIPQKLNLTADYLQANKLVTTAQCIARLQALKQAGIKQQGRLTLPEVALGLETLTNEGQQLMQYAAYLDAYFIPCSLVSALLGEDNQEQLSKVVRDLSRLSLVQVISTQEGQELGLQVHREVQVSCREYADWRPAAALGTRETILLQLARVLNAQMPLVDSAPYESWQQAKLYVPHVATVVTALEKSGAAPSAVVARLLFLMGMYNHQVGLNYRQAVSYYKRALAIYEQVYQATPYHPDIAMTLNNLGLAWSGLGDARQAIIFLEHALEIFEQIYQGKPNHPDIAMTLNNLGAAWRDLGDARQAASFYECALKIFEQICKEAPYHPNIALTLNNLGLAWRDLGDERQAVSFLERALAIYEQIYKTTPNHPNIASTLNNLGAAWRDLGDARQAVIFLERALAIYEQIYQATPNHPEIAMTLNNLGNAWSDLGDERQAVSFLERALAIYEQAYQGTPNHPEIAKTLNNLGDSWWALGDGKKAVSFHERALAIYEQIYQETPNHPDIAMTLNNLGLAWSDLGDGRQAVSYLERALEIFEQIYQGTPNHPDIAMILNNLGNAWRDLGDGLQAVSFYERALEIYEQIYQATPNHPDIANTLNNLGNTWGNLGDARKAVSFLKRALAIYEQVHDADHPHRAIASRNLERARRALGEDQGH